MFIRHISKFCNISKYGAVFVGHNVSARTENLANNVVQSIYPGQIRPFHTQIGVSLSFREKIDFDGERRRRSDYNGGQKFGSHRNNFDAEDELESRSSHGGQRSGWNQSRHQVRSKPRLQNWLEEDINDRGEDFGSKLKKKDWQKAELLEIKKNLYEAQETSLNRSQEEVESFREMNKISIIRGKNLVPNPVMSFEEVGFSAEILQILEKTDFKSPMPIQSQGWPIAMSGMDLIGIGQTGSGKTLGFVLPAIVHIKAQEGIRRGDGPIALVIAPTRELAQQTQKVVETFGRSSRIRSVCLFGGVSRMPQINELRRGVEMVIATPGRLIDLLETEDTNLDRCSYVVLDEADRCLDMGFEPQLRTILNRVRPDRQMLMWSATWPQEVRQLARDFFTTETNDGQGYIHLNIGSTELQANHNIEQKVEVIHQSQKVSRLLDLLRTIRNESSGSEDDEKSEKNSENSRILIFAATKKTVDFIERIIIREGHRAVGIHGDKSQLNRDSALHHFRTGRTPILVATDVASRGLDVDDIKYVINFDFPNLIEDYIHRIGRTGRRNRQGTAFTFITEDNAKQVVDLIKVLQEAKQEVPIELMEFKQSNESLRLNRNGSFSAGKSRYNKSYTFQNRQSKRHSFNIED